MQNLNPALDSVRIAWFHDLNEFHYEMSRELLQEFCNRIRQDGMEKAWDWFVGNVDYGCDGDEGKPIGHNSLLANHNLYELGLDHDYVEEFLTDADEFLNDE